MSHLIQQQGAPPPIPTMPTRPGAATGAATGAAQAPVAGVGTGGGALAGTPGDEARAAVNEVRDVIRDAIRTSVQTTAPQGEPTIIVPSGPDFPQIPREVIPLVGMSLGLIVAMIVGYPIARAIGRVIERRGEVGIVKASDVAPQLRQLQDSVDTMAIELERISEAQRFTAKLMAERSAALPSGESRPG